MGGAPIDLVGLSGVGKYYRIDSFSLEFTRGTIDFDPAAVDYITILNDSASHRTLINKLMFSEPFGAPGDQKAVVINSFGIVATVANIVYFEGGVMNSTIKLTTRNGADFTLGNGTAKVKIKFTRITAN